MTCGLRSRLARLEAAGQVRPFLLIASTPEDADRLLAEHRGGPVIIVPPVAKTVEEWLSDITGERCTLATHKRVRKDSGSVLRHHKAAKRHAGELRFSPPFAELVG